MRHWRLRLAYPTYGNKCSTSEDTCDSPKVDSESSSSPAMSEINPIDNAEACFPHGNIVCHHSYDACKRSNEPSGCLKLESILWQLVRIIFVGSRDSFWARFLPPWQFFSCCRNLFDENSVLRFAFTSSTSLLHVVKKWSRISKIDKFHEFLPHGSHILISSSHFWCHPDKK